MTDDEFEKLMKKHGASHDDMTGCNLIGCAFILIPLLVFWGLVAYALLKYTQFV